mmetsp:Transcript_1112/g.2202  ORF Transcript_1112/g.2202 Transcript_1112/m.2202 type:complete len:638 (-) Transcript_1112:77-1990(-)
MTASANCITSLADMNIQMVAGATLELCPGTYPVGAPLDSTLTSFAGGIPLIVDVDNVSIKCGISGASANGCILEGGFVQLFIGNPNTPTSTANNLNIQGITFTGVMETGTISGVTGAPRNVLGSNTANTVTFTDCLFKDITTNGYVMDIEPDQTTSNSMVVKLANSAFTNIAHSFDVIYANPLADIQFDSVTFTNMTHIPPLADVDKCTNLTLVTCGYTSSIINLAYSNYITATLADSFISVTVADSTYYTAILQTIADWGFGTVDTFSLLITATNNTIYSQSNRTANDAYCEGGYAAAYNGTTGIDWQCKRLNYTLDVLEILRCGINCDANGNFSTLLDVLATTGLDATINANTNAVAIFAPTNTAFANLPPGMLADLKANDVTTLTDLLKYHVTLEDPITTEAIALGLPAALTTQGESVSFTPPTVTNPYYSVDAASIIHPDWDESPGAGKVVHVTDRVINPSTIPILPSFAQLVESLNLTLFIAAAQAVAFDPNLDPEKTYTLFAPSNAAIQNSTVAQQMLASGDKAPLTEMLRHHFVEGNFSIADLQAAACQDKTSLASKNIKITYTSDLRWNDVITNTSVVDQLAYNGIVHVVDGLMSITDIKACNSAASGIPVAMSMAFGLAGTILAMFVF